MCVSVLPLGKDPGLGLPHAGVPAYGILSIDCRAQQQVHVQDNLAMSAIRFLTALAKSVHSKLFSDDSTLKQVRMHCQRVSWGLMAISLHTVCNAVIRRHEIYLLCLITFAEACRDCFLDSKHTARLQRV